MIISVGLQTKSKLGTEPSQLNELLSDKATRVNYTLIIYQGNILLVLFSQSIINNVKLRNKDEVYENVTFSWRVVCCEDCGLQILNMCDISLRDEKYEYELTLLFPLKFKHLQSCNSPT